MNVALIARTSIFSTKGGDTTQIVKTALELNNLGVKADIFKATDSIPYEKYDLLHFFNIIRPSDHLFHIKASKKPYLVSSIYLDYSSFDRGGRSKLQSNVFRILGKHGAEYIKNLYRFYKKQDQLVSKEYLLGHKRAMRKIIQGAAMLLPNSKSEYNRLAKDLSLEQNYMVVPNGIDISIFGEIPSGIQRKDKVICVAQVYGRKNQHKLIKACSNLNIPLDIIGKAPPNHKSYLDYCKEIAGDNVNFFDFMPQEELLKHYAEAKVHALPSWFETTGLCTLEAGAMGCNIVVGEGGDTRDYFQDFASFCDAADQKSIEDALKNALSNPVDEKLRDTIIKKYTWQKAAIATK